MFDEDMVCPSVPSLQRRPSYVSGPRLDRQGLCEEDQAPEQARDQDHQPDGKGESDRVRLCYPQGGQRRDVARFLQTNAVETDRDEADERNRASDAGEFDQSHRDVHCQSQKPLADDAGR